MLTNQRIGFVKIRAHSWAFLIRVSSVLHPWLILLLLPRRLPPAFGTPLRRRPQVIAAVPAEAEFRPPSAEQRPTQQPRRGGEGEEQHQGPTPDGDDLLVANIPPQDRSEPPLRIVK
jgi:hypothetical protein